MNTGTISSRALSVIDQYLRFKVGNAVCSVPYFNNKTVKARGALSAYIGKGSPQEISDEVQALAVKAHANVDSFDDASLKKMLVDNNIGIDCSGFAYHVLDAENEELGKGGLDKRLSFVQSKGLLGRIKAALRPVENAGVRTFADNANSRVIPLKDVQPGDIITMLDTNDNSTELSNKISGDRDHILVVHRVEYQDSIPTKIHYSHAVAYPEDGVYGSSIKQGAIGITDIDTSLIGQAWSENGSAGENSRIFVRAKKSKTEVRRLKWI